MGFLLEQTRQFALSLEEPVVVKTAAKDKITRAKVISNLEKVKKEYLVAKKQKDSLENEKMRIEMSLDKINSECSSARKRMQKLYQTVQHMDLTDAGAAIFYEGSEDVGYVVDGKEFHLDIDNSGEMNLVPMNKFRRDRKKSMVGEPESEPVSEDADDIDDVDNPIENLYSNLLQR